MIHLLLTRDHRYTASAFLRSWGYCLRERVCLVAYEGRPWGRDALPGTWIFADLERLRPSELADAASWADRLAAVPERYRLLNHPARALKRHDLLARLADAGVNRFRAYRAEALPETLRFPVFVRGENDHDGSIGGLLNSRAEVDAALASAGRRGLLVIEFLDYARTDAIFAKYSIMRAGPHLVRRHILFSRNWMLKQPDLLDSALLDEEVAFVSRAPEHQDQVATIFDLANVDYGRMDYTLVDGRVQVFEINTNPVLVPNVSGLAPERWLSQAISARALHDALATLDAGLPEPRPTEIQAAVARERRERLASLLLDALRRRPPRR